MKEIISQIKQILKKSIKNEANKINKQTQIQKIYRKVMEKINNQNKTIKEKKWNQIIKQQKYSEYKPWIKNYRIKIQDIKIKPKQNTKRQTRQEYIENWLKKRKIRTILIKRINKIRNQNPKNNKKITYYKWIGIKIKTNKEKRKQIKSKKIYKSKRGRKIILGVKIRKRKQIIKQIINQQSQYKVRNRIRKKYYSHVSLYKYNRHQNKSKEL